MWVVHAQDVKGDRLELPYEVLTGVPTMADAVASARALLTKTGVDAPIHLLEGLTKGGGAVPGFDGVKRWGADAVRELETISGATYGVAFQDPWLVVHRESKAPRTVAVSHDPTMLVLPIDERVDSLELAYDAPNGLEFEPPIEGERTDVFEFHLLVGKDSQCFTSYATGWHTLWEGLRAGFRTGALLLGKTFRVVTRGSSVIAEDATWQSRLRLLEDACPEAAEFQRLGPDANRTDKAIVVIHGTASCGINVIQPMLPLNPCVPLFRFEHDTCIHVEHNAVELADRIMGLGCNKVLLVAHSRGGLVGCAAAAHLAAQSGIGGRRAPPSVETWTFGTPHEGTPAVEAAQGVLELLAPVPALLAPRVEILRRWESALRYMTITGETPAGFAAMIADSPFLATHLARLRYLNIQAWGGRIDLAQTTCEGFWQFALSSMMTRMYGEPHDLVVPLASALPSALTPTERKHELEDCAHSEFFERDDAKRRIEAWGCESDDARSAPRPDGLKVHQVENGIQVGDVPDLPYQD